jgi:hypothetical protein
MGNAYLGKGYNYQDFLTTAVIMQNLVKGDNCEFWFDKTIGEDFFDDFKTINGKANLHLQIKYSDVDSEVKESDFYKNKVLSLFDIFKSANNIQSRFLNAENIFILAIKKKYIMEDILEKASVDYINCIDNLEYFRFSESFLLSQLGESYSKDSILANFKNVYLSFGYPDFSQQTFSPGNLESILISLTRKLGIGCFPNKDKSPEYFIDNLVSYVCSLRNDTSKNKTSKIRTSEDIIKYTQLNTDFGRLDQLFGIDKSIFVSRKNDIENLVDTIENNKRLILTGAPGSGKSYLTYGLFSTIEEKGINYLKHYCYLGYDEKTSDLRVRTDNLIGNIIDELLEMYPEVRQFKETTYGATIDDLNNLLINLPEKTFLFIDGVDHAYRSYKKDERNLSYNNYDLVEIVSKLIINNSLHVIVISQDIAEIDSLVQLGYTKYQIPLISGSDSVKIINNISNQFTGHDFCEKLLVCLVNRANGNGLILTYLTKYVIINNLVSQDDFDQIPHYNGNIEEYYEQLNIVGSTLDIVCYLALSESPLSYEELVHISGKTLKIEFQSIRPYLVENSSAGGYYFFHESLKRFLLEKKVTEIYDLKKYRNDIINYWISKDFFEYEKAYLYLFRLMFINKRFNEIYNSFDFQFLVSSKLAGYSNNQIRENLNYIKMASLKDREYKPFLMALESLKIVDFEFGQDIIEKHPKEFYSVLVKSNLNANFLQRYLVDVGDINAYLDSLRVLDENYMYNWTELIELYFGKANDINKVYLLYKNDEFNKNYILQWKLDEKKLLELFIIIRDILGESDVESFIKKQNQTNYVYLALVFNSVYLNNQIVLKREKELDLFKYQDYSLTILYYISDLDQPHLTEDSQSKLEYYRNDWFYVQFLRYVKKLHNTKGLFKSHDKVIELYDLFSDIYKPFIGNPKVPDIHDNMGIYTYLLLLPITEISDKRIFLQIVELLVTMSEKINSTLWGIEFNPISLSKFLGWIPKIFDKNQRKWFVEYVNNKIESNKGYVVYDQSLEELISLAEITSSFDMKLSSEYFEEAVRLSMTYGYHKDRTLSDILDSYSSCFYEVSQMEYIQKMHYMANELQYVTDRKDTSHYPVEWAEQISETNLDLVIDYIAHRYMTIDESGYTDEMLKALFEKGVFDDVDDHLYISLVGRECCIESRLFIDKIISKLKDIKKGPFRVNVIRMLSHVGYNRLQEYEPFEELHSILKEINITVIPKKKDSVVSSSKNSSFRMKISTKEDVDKYFNRSLWSRDALAQDEMNNILKDLDPSMKQYFLIKYYLHQADGWGRIFVHEDILFKAYEINKSNFDNLFEKLFFERINNLEYFALSIPNMIKSFNIIPHYREYAKQMWLGAYNIITQRIPEYKKDNSLQNFFIDYIRTKDPIKNLSEKLNDRFGEPFFA